MSTPAKSRWSRMGSVVRRTSSVLIPSRPASVRSSSSEDLTLPKPAGASPPQAYTQAPALAPPAPSSSHHSTAPSPIAESPIREAAASQEGAVIGPSPLARAARADTPESDRAQGNAEQGAAQQPLSPTSAQSETGYVPPPVLDSSAVGPGAFTDEPDELPQPLIIKAPSLVPTEEVVEESRADEGAPAPALAEDREVPAKQGETEHYGEVVERSPVDFNESIWTSPPFIPAGKLEELQHEPTVLSEAPLVEEPASITEYPAAESSKEENTFGAAVMPVEEHPVFPLPLPSFPAPTGHNASYFEVPAQPQAREAPAQEAFKASVEANAALEPHADAPAPQPQVIAGEASGYYDSPFNAAPMPVPMHHQQEPAPPPMPVPTHHEGSGSTPYSLDGGQEVWGGAAVVVAGAAAGATAAAILGLSKPVERVANGHATGRSRSSTIRMPAAEDPFADPIAPRITVSQMEQRHQAHVPYPEQINQQPSAAPTHSDDGQGPVSMPLPPFNEVIPGNRSIHQESIAPSRHYERDTDETRPLLSRPETPKASYLQSSPAAHNYVSISPNTSAGPSDAAVDAVASLHNRGWIEYHLPDGTVYYVHPTLRVTTDVDLRAREKLDAVARFLEQRKDRSAPAGAELWLRDVGAPKKAPVVCWVDHKARSIVFDAPGVGRKPREVEDQMDIEYRYWSFMEAHPAHASLPLSARAEAMDVLTWAWTDRLLPSHRAVPAPFTQEECQELMALLRSFDTQGDSGLQTVVQTRIVSRVLLRVSHWRQLYFRPNKPLPKDANQGGLVPNRRPLRRAVLDFFISAICLGIPYIFFERTHHQRMDEESGIRSAAPMLVIGACTCLVAAIVLSASVTFLSLPGLDSVARVVGLVAILLATFSMASTIVAIFRFKADMERTVPHVGGEGLLMLSRRSIVMSLPLVFLAYAVMSFVAGIVLYTIRGVTITDPLLVQRRFEDYAKWTVIGVLGGLAGIFTTSLLLLRR